MGLIDVPKTKEEIQAYLADGNTHNTPFITGADINDGDILGATNTVDLGNGSYKFTIQLPSGRPLESAGISADYNKRDASMQWVDAVRANIIGDYESAAEESIAAARRSSGLEAPPTGLTPAEIAATTSHTSHVGRQPAGTGTTGGYLSADPVEYAKSQLTAALERLAALTSAEADVSKWRKVVQSLTGENPQANRRRKRRKRKVNAASPSPVYSYTDSKHPASAGRASDMPGSVHS
jgi:hypothetical protein